MHILHYLDEVVRQMKQLISYVPFSTGKYFFTFDFDGS